MPRFKVCSFIWYVETYQLPSRGRTQGQGLCVETNGPESGQMLVKLAQTHILRGLELTLDVHVSMIVLPKPMTTRPPTTRPKESSLEPAADMTAPMNIIIEQAIEPLCERG